MTALPISLDTPLGLTPPRAGTLRLGLVQLPVIDANPPANISAATVAIARAPEADVYLLPELWTTGYAQESWAAAADHHAATLDVMCTIARTVHAAVAGSFVGRDDAGALVNRFVVVDRDGRVAGWYDKVHLFAPMLEDRHFRAGARRARCELDGWPTALSICFDLRFPEMYRLDAVDGAELFLVVAEWPAARADAMRTLARARAIENQAYVALVNRAGVASDGTRFGGGSLIVAPDGEVVAEANGSAQVVIGELDRARVRAVRESFAVLPLRRPGVDW